MVARQRAGQAAEKRGNLWLLGNKRVGQPKSAGVCRLHRLSRRLGAGGFFWPILGRARPPKGLWECPGTQVSHLRGNTRRGLVLVGGEKGVCVALSAVCDRPSDERLHSSVLT